MQSILETFLQVVHLLVCAMLILVVLLQQGKGGGMGAAFGGGAGGQVFGGRGAGNLLTRATSVCAAVFMMTSVSLAYLSSSGDRALKARAAIAAEDAAKKGTARPREKSDTDKPEAPKDEKAPAPNETPSPTSSK
ncbi:MAG: preprotein translocase subunit SecG [Polyangiaceae bacterium]